MAATIDGIKILSVSGLAGGNGAGAESGGALPDQLVNSALRFRAQAPLVDSLLREIGIDGAGGIEQATRVLANGSAESAS